MRRIAGFLVALALAAPAAAAPIFPPLVEGNYAFRVRTADVEVDADGVPTSTPTASVGIRRMDEPGDFLTCVAAGPGEIAAVMVSVAASGARAELRGFAFPGPDCTGEPSEPSGNGAYLFFVPPAAPSLEP